MVSLSHAPASLSCYSSIHGPPAASSAFQYFKWPCLVEDRPILCCRSRRPSCIRAQQARQDPSYASDFSLPPNQLPTGRWKRALVQGERKFNVTATEAVVNILDAFYENRPYARFYVLETIARVPYFAFMSVLHLYESLGWWRRAEYLKVHFAESWNELHHLLIMESLGGDRQWGDRFVAQHIAVAYFFLTAAMYTLNPRMAYHFSECVEQHAFDTYDKFVRKYGEDLRQLPPPEVAVRYYTEGDLYLFDEFQTSHAGVLRRPKIENLLDVFCAIREDEAEHCKTMRACQTPSAISAPLRVTNTSPSPQPLGEGSNAKVFSPSMVPPAECAGIIECAITATSYAERANIRTTMIMDRVEDEED